MMTYVRRGGSAVGRWVAFYAKNLWHKASHDQIFFLSSGITFNVLVTIVPLLLLSISILGMLVESSGAARDQVLAFIERAMPLAGNQADSLLSSLVEDRGLFGLIGSVGLIWAATRLFGSLRTVLEVVFEIPPEDRLGIVEGKIHDIRMVIIVGTLFVATISLTTGLQWVEDYGIPFLGLEAYDLSRLTAFGSMLMAFSITYLMFYFVYRYVPDRWIPRTDAAIAALFSSLLFELAKQVFIAYLSNFGRLMQFYGSFTNLVVVAFWVYYSSIVFMLGGELARIVQFHRRKGVEPTWGLRGPVP